MPAIEKASDVFESIADFAFDFWVKKNVVKVVITETIGDISNIFVLIACKTPKNSGDIGKIFGQFSFVQPQNFPNLPVILSRKCRKVSCTVQIFHRLETGKPNGLCPKK